MALSPLPPLACLQAFEASARYLSFTRAGQELHLSPSAVSRQILQSIVGSVFGAKVLSKTTEGQFDAVIPEVEGTAFVYGFATWLIDERDPMKNGFLVR